jgi:hypothetical protein
MSKWWILKKIRTSFFWREEFQEAHRDGSSFEVPTREKLLLPHPFKERERDDHFGRL